MSRVDWYQAGAIIANTLRREFRPKSKARKGSALRSYAVVMTFSGITAGLFTVLLPDPFTAAFFAAAIWMAFIGCFILLEFSVIATGPEDYAFFAARPVSAATYFISKLLSILVMVLAFTGIFFLPILVIHLIRHTPAAVIGGYLYAVLIGGLTMSSMVLVLFSAVSRYVPQSAVRNVTSVVQLTLFLAVLLGMNFLVQRFGEGAYALSIGADSPLVLLPNGWAAAVFALGEGGVLPKAAAVLPYIVGGLLFWYSKNILALGYAERLAAGRPAAARDGRAPRAVRFRFWREFESQALVLLLRNHLTYNSQTRTGLFMVFPLTVFYFVLVLVINDQPLIDPFTAAGRESFSGTANLYIMFGLIPLLVKNALTYSTEQQASWVFFSAPIRRIKLVDTAGTLIVAFFLIPYTLLVFGVFTALTGAVLHSMQHFLIIMLIMLVLTDFLLYAFPDLPFSREYRRGQRGAGIILRAVIVIMVLPPLLHLMVRFVYPDQFRYWGAAGALVLLWYAVRRTGRRYAERKLQRQEFAG